MSEKSFHDPGVQFSIPASQRRLMIGIISGGLVIGAVSLIFLFKSHLYRDRTGAPIVTLSKFQNPIAGLSIDISRMVDLLEKQTDLQKEQDDIAYLIGRLKKMGINTFDVFFFPDTDHFALPVVALRSDQEITFKQLLSGDSLFAPYVEEITENQYRLKKETLTEEDWSDFPVDIYRFRLINNVFFIVPEPLFKSFPMGYDMIEQSPAAQFSDTIKGNNAIVGLTLRIPVNFTTSVQDKFNNYPLWEEYPLAGMVADTVMTGFQQLAEPFELLQYMALELRLDGDNRYLRYAHLFQSAVDGAAVYERLKDKDADIGTGLIGSILTLLKDPRVSVDFDFKENRLTFDIGWKKVDDEPVLQALAQATIGKIFEQTMLSGEPTQDAITASYTTAPQLTLQVDQTQLKSNLSQQIRMGLFPNSFWSNNEEPYMDMELDPVDVPNASLVKGEIDVLRINTLDGRDVHHLTKKSAGIPVQFDTEQKNHIQLNVVPGTRMEDLNTAVLRFKVSIPTNLCIFNFKADVRDKTKKKDGFLVTAERVERDIAEIYSRSGSDIWVFAYDKTGQAISEKESISSSSGIFKRFNGAIDRLQVVMAENTIEYTFDVETDLNGGKKIELSHKPQVPPRVRLEYSPVDKYVVISAKTLAELQVEWFEDAANAWDLRGLKIKLPSGPYHGHAQWETYFYCEDREHSITGTSYSSGNAFGFWVNSNKLKNAHAVFGKVDIAVASKIEKLQFNDRAGQALLKQHLSTGEVATLAFNQNEIAYRTDSAEVIQVHAFDSENRHLKKDNYFRNKKGTVFLYFWGIPARVEMTIATDFHTRTIDFDLQERPVNIKSYKEFKNEINRRKNRGDSGIKP